MNFTEQVLLAAGGYLFHLLKQWYESVKRKESFDYKLLLISVGMNILAILILVYIGKQLPPDLIVMSPLTCVIIGFSGSSLLAGFIAAKKPKDIPDDESQAVPPPKP